MAALRKVNEGERRGSAATAAALLVAALLAGLLAGRPAAAQSDPGYATQPFTPKDFHMPEGQGCTGDVARWRAVQDNDYASGNIGLKVYHQIAAEIGRAEAACQGGHDEAARAMIHASKRSHGYPD